MSFKEAGKSNEGSVARDNGLPLNWENLQWKCCPRCGDEMTEFEHLKLWKCGCGFNISESRKNEIVYDIQDGVNISRNGGYGYSKYHDHSPF